MFKIALNNTDINLPPWRIEKPNGEKVHADYVEFRGKACTATEKLKTNFRGWIICDGNMNLKMEEGITTVIFE